MAKASEDRVRAWAGRLRRQAASGLSIAAFCRREQVSPATFYFWKRRLRTEGCEPTGAPSSRVARRSPRASSSRGPRRTMGGGPSPDDFVPVTLAATLAVIIELPNRARVQLPPGCDRDTLAAAISAAGQLPVCAEDAQC